MTKQTQKLFLAAGLSLALCACMTDQSDNTNHRLMASHGNYNNSQNRSSVDGNPTYSTNGSYDDNGAEPPPNNGNQNFGRRW